MGIALLVWGLTLRSLQTRAPGPPGLRALHARLLCLPLAGIWSWVKNKKRGDTYDPTEDRAYLP